jgi:hypothetical protein
VGDFEHDGVNEAVVSLYMGGNACPAPWYALARPADGRVSLSSIFGDCSGPLRVVSIKGGADEFAVDGWETTEVFQPRKGAVLRVRTEHVRVLDAKPVVTHEGARRSPGGHDLIRIDLEGDGRIDTIDCTALRNLTCTITGSDGSDWGTVMAPDRVGVLASQTNGHRDLVVGPRTIVRWNGHGYE